jgi:uncharacterized protein YkwD
MGRHRRVPHAPEPPAVRYDAGPTVRYDMGPAAYDAARQRGSHRRPVAPPQRAGGFSARAGILGASAAVAMGAVAVASTVVPSPGGGSGTQYSDRIQAEGPRDQSPEVPSVPSPEGGADAPGADGGGDEGATVPPDSSQNPGEGSQDPDASQPADPGSDAGDDSESSGPGNGKSNGKGNGKGGSEASSRSPADAAEAEVFNLVNEERDKAGCKDLKPDDELIDLAGDFSRDMAVEGFFSHLSPDGKSPWDRADDLGIGGLGGENIARGQKTAESVMEDWMDSPSHKANILNCDFRTIGIGAYEDEEDSWWWTQNFGY